MIYNDGGTLIPKGIANYPTSAMVGSVWPYPMRALGLDCTWIKSNDLPVCFFASMEDGALGVSRLIELDPTGYSRLAADPALSAYYSWRIPKRLAARKRQSFETVPFPPKLTPTPELRHHSIMKERNNVPFHLTCLP